MLSADDCEGSYFMTHCPMKRWRKWARGRGTFSRICVACFLLLFVALCRFSIAAMFVFLLNGSGGLAWCWLDEQGPGCAVTTRPVTGNGACAELARMDGPRPSISPGSDSRALASPFPAPTRLARKPPAPGQAPRAFTRSPRAFTHSRTPGK